MVMVAIFKASLVFVFNFKLLNEFTVCLLFFILVYGNYNKCFFLTLICVVCIHRECAADRISQVYARVLCS